MLYQQVPSDIIAFSISSVISKVLPNHSTSVISAEAYDLFKLILKPHIL